MKNKVDEVYNKSKKGLCIFLAFVMCVSLLSFAGSYRKTDHVASAMVTEPSSDSASNQK